MSHPQLSVVLPAYNERENITDAVDRAVEALEGIEELDSFEVIVVDDGSSDGTDEIARELLERYAPRMRLLRHRINEGYGAAIATGFKAARGDLVFYTDADNQFDVSELRWFLPLVEHADVIVGFRAYRYDTAIRSFLSWAYNLLVRVLFRVRVRDVDCAFKLFRREVLEKVTIESRDFFVDTEMVAKARKWNFRVVEKGVRHYPRLSGETTVRASDIPRTLLTVATMWRHIYFPTPGILEEAARMHRELDAVSIEITAPA